MRWPPLNIVFISTAHKLKPFLQVDLYHKTYMKQLPLRGNLLPFISFN